MSLPAILRLGMQRRPTIAIIGAGNLGAVLASRLDAAGYRVREIVSRSPRKTSKARKVGRQVRARVTIYTRPDLSSDVIWLSVPDRAIAGCANSLAASTDWRGKIVFHSSGALTSGELAPLRRAGAAVASVHPLMTFVPGVVPQLKGIPFAVEGDRAATSVARRVVADLGGDVFTVKKSDKVAYHAWGAFISPLVVALLTSAEEVAKHAGISSTAARKRMLPILQQTLANFATSGPAGAFSGPLIRGDAATVQQHLGLLQQLPAARQVYISLARSALTSLPVKNREQLSRLLGKEKVPRSRRK